MGILSLNKFLRDLGGLLGEKVTVSFHKIQRRNMIS